MYSPPISEKSPQSLPVPQSPYTRQASMKAVPVRPVNCFLVAQLPSKGSQPRCSYLSWRIR